MQTIKCIKLPTLAKGPATLLSSTDFGHCANGYLKCDAKEESTLVVPEHPIYEPFFFLALKTSLFIKTPVSSLQISN